MPWRENADGPEPSNEVRGATCADGNDNDCNGLTDFADHDCADAVPTASTWGLMILTLLLLVGAMVYFGLRSTTTGAPEAS
ncbi:MAG: hypothetical protein ACE5E5_07955 [Phycisphaerae bacterium]